MLASPPHIAIFSCLDFSSELFSILQDWSISSGGWLLRKKFADYSAASCSMSAFCSTSTTTWSAYGPLPSQGNDVDAMVLLQRPTGGAQSIPLLSVLEFDV